MKFRLNRCLARILFILLVFAAESAPAAQLTEVRIGSSDISLSNVSTFYAHDRGLFEKEGLDAKLILVKTEAALAAQSTGDLDYTTFSTSVIDAAVKGIPARLVAVTVTQPAVGLVVRKGIENVTDLKGRKVGVSSFGGLMHVAALYVLKHYGLGPKNVSILATGPGNSGIAALKAGAIDGAFLPAPYDMRMAREGFSLILDVGTLYQLPFGGISATPTKIREKPGEVERVLRAVLQAGRLIADPKNSEDVTAYIMRLFKLDRSLAEPFYRRLVSALSLTGIVEMDKIRLAIDSAVERGVIDKPVDPSTVVDFSIARRIYQK
ncbi:MAG TPA: ABC transporter substrate-binding protein [Candidatus Acidoferrales bacterium]|nr:ABC transporter substrate-binding protein [Candidatus Acidoferrales bacterium]